MPKHYANLMRLRSEAARQMTEENYRAGESSVDLYVEGLERPISLDPLRAVVAECIKRHSDLEPKNRFKSDAWLTPRLHSALRLWRREAGDIGVWHFLTVVVFREYVLWRWGHNSGLYERLLGHDRRNALAHLWWAAELARNGADYAPVVQACRLQEIIVTLTDVDASQNRAAAQAFLRYCKERGRDDVQRLRKAMNCSLVTYMLDAAAPDKGPDAKAIADWISEEPEEALLLLDDLPEGPNEQPVPESDIQDVIQQLTYIEEQMPKAATSA